MSTTDMPMPKTTAGKTPELGALPRDAIAAMTGVETFEAMLAGRLPAPPIMKSMNIMLREVDKGRALFEGTPVEDFLNPQGTIHGGWISTIMDTALSCAVHTDLAPGEFYTTTSLTVNMVRPLLAGSGLATCEGHVVHRGSRLATAEGKLHDARGKLIAHGTVTCMVFKLEK